MAYISPVPLYTFFCNFVFVNAISQTNKITLLKSWQNFCQCHTLVPFWEELCWYFFLSLFFLPSFILELLRHSDKPRIFLFFGFFFFHKIYACKLVLQFLSYWDQISSTMYSLFWNGWLVYSFLNSFMLLIVFSLFFFFFTRYHHHCSTPAKPIQPPNIIA